MRKIYAPGSADAWMQCMFVQFLVQAAGQQFEQPWTHGNSMMAESPWNAYTASVLMYGLAVGVLVGALIIGGLLVVNLGMLSKRTEDRVGGRSPSDVGILQQNVWPERQISPRQLPAEDDDFESLDKPGPKQAA